MVPTKSGDESRPFIGMVKHNQLVISRAKVHASKDFVVLKFIVSDDLIVFSTAKKYLSRDNTYMSDQGRDSNPKSGANSFWEFGGFEPATPPFLAGYRFCSAISGALR